MAGDGPPCDWPCLSSLPDCDCLPGQQACRICTSKPPAICYCGGMCASPASYTGSAHGTRAVRCSTQPLGATCVTQLLRAVRPQVSTRQLPQAWHPVRGQPLPPWALGRQPLLPAVSYMTVRLQCNLLQRTVTHYVWYGTMPYGGCRLQACLQRAPLPFTITQDPACLLQGKHASRVRAGGTLDC